MTAEGAGRLGEAFLRTSFVGADPAEIATPAVRPTPFKIYPGPRLGLPHRLVPPTAMLSECLNPASDGTDLSLDRDRIARLLYFTFGLSRYDVGSEAAWPWHRFVPSARCFFPVQLYVWIRRAVGLPSGLFHYDPVHHSLAPVRGGDPGAVLSRAVDADLSGFDAGLIVTARYWKTAFRYGSFAYRLCTQEAGLVSGNALLVLSALQMRTTLRLLFVDRDVNALLGVGLPTESALALLPFAASVRTVSVSEFSAEQLTLCREPAESGLDAARFWRLLKLEASSHLTALTPASWPQAPTVCDGEHRSTATDAVMGNMRLADALWRRSSGDVYFAPIARSLAISTVRDIAVAATAALDSDLGSYRPRHSVYLALNRVSGLTPGIYQACRSCRDIHAVLQGDVAVRLQAAYMQHAVNCAAAPIVAFIVADTKTWFGLFGDRGYRLMNIEAGVIAQRIAIACATHDLVARCTDAFQEDACANLLGIDATSKVSLFQIVIGEERKGAGGNGRYRLPLRF